MRLLIEQTAHLLTERAEAAKYAGLWMSGTIALHDVPLDDALAVGATKPLLVRGIGRDYAQMQLVIGAPEDWLTLTLAIREQDIPRMESIPGIRVRDDRGVADA